MTIINPNSISGISSITALNSTAAINLFKADGTSANIIAGVTTGSNFITGTSNVHSTGYECTNINASGIVTAASLDISGDIDFDGHTNLDNVSIAGVTTITSAAPELHFTDTNADSDYSIVVNTGQFRIRDETNSANRLAVNSDGHVDIYGRLDAIGGFLASSDATIEGDLTLTSTDAGSSAAPIINLFRNSASPADADYLGQIKFQGESDTGVQRNYAKITGKILDASNGTEDGILEFAHIKAGSQTITGRWRSDSLQLLNSTNFSVAGTSDFTGTATFSGVSNFNSNVSVSGDLSIAQDLVHTGDTDTKLRLFNDTIALNTAGIERIKIHNDGTVGIGQSSKSGTVGAGGLDIQGNATNCIIEMGNPFPTFSGGVVPEFRITATNSGHEVKFESVWGGDNLLHPHIAFTGGRTHFYTGTNSNEIARFDSDRFWINTTSGHGQFQVHDGTIVHSKPAGGGTRNYRFVNNNTAAGDYGIQISTTEAGTTYTNHTELKRGGDVQIHDGNLVVASGHGIDFSATGNASNASASMSSELFDDYEEGTFTPTDVSGHGITITNNNPAHYTKIGRFVHVTFDCTWAGGHSAGGNAQISLPFAMGEEYGSGSVGWNQVNKPLQVHVNSSGAAIMENYSNGSGGRHLSNNSASGNRIIGDCSYFTGT